MRSPEKDVRYSSAPLLTGSHRDAVCRPLHSGHSKMRSASFRKAPARAGRASPSRPGDSAEAVDSVCLPSRPQKNGTAVSSASLRAGGSVPPEDARNRGDRSPSSDPVARAHDPSTSQAKAALPSHSPCAAPRGTSQAAPPPSGGADFWI